MKVKFNGKVTGSGKLTLYNKEAFKEELTAFAGRDVSVIVERRVKKRSNLQNSYYWGVIIPLIRKGLFDLGNVLSISETHSFLKDNFNSKELINEETGELFFNEGKPMTVSGSTTELTTTDFMAFIESIQRWSVEYLGVNIPSPGEVLEIEFKHE